MKSEPTSEARQHTSEDRHYYMDINDHFNSKMGLREHLQTTHNITYGQPVALGCGASETVHMEGILG